MIDFKKSTPDQREATLGREFREIQVCHLDTRAYWSCVVILDGKRVVLLGDPVKALQTYLGGAPEDGEVVQ